MKLFPAKEEKILRQLLARAVDQDDVLTLAGLHGFLYCLAIIPEAIMPSEWFPYVFGEESLDIESEEEANRMMGGLLAVYNRFIRASSNDELQFPFDIASLKAADLNKVREWSYGFFLGTQLRPEVWGLPDDEEELPEEDSESSEEEQEAVACMAVLMSIAFPDRLEELFEQQSPLAERERRTREEREASLFVMLPRVIESLHAIANEYRDEMRQGVGSVQAAPQPARRSEKVGRNDPCPCGSGRKYKKCCGAN